MSILDPVKLNLLNHVGKDDPRQICEFRRSHHWLLCILCASYLSIIILCVLQSICVSSNLTIYLKKGYLTSPVLLFLNLVYSKTKDTILQHSHQNTAKHTHTHIQCQCCSQRNGPVCLHCNRGSFSLWSRFI